MDPMPLDRATQQALRELAPRVLAVLVRRYGDFAACEDAVQEALLAAAARWPRDGMPGDPRGWLVRVAGRKMIDRIRSERSRRDREAIVVALVPAEDQLVRIDDDPSAEDDPLEVLFMSCHPALSPASAIALTLRAVGGLTTREIATAFLAPETTVAQRISRAKQTIKGSGVPFGVPSAEDRATRLASVMHVLYLIFNEGYTASSGPELHRVDLSNEALRLARLLHRMVPDEPEAAGLLALMLLTDARRAARTGPCGELVPLDRQDRTRWDAEAIAEGVGLLEVTLPKGGLGPYQVQAAIAAVHDEAARAEDTDWAQILALYEVLMAMSDNPMVALNHAIALAMVHGPAVGLQRLDALEHDPRLREHHRLEAARAHLLLRAGQRDRAIACFLRAAERTNSRAEREYLLVTAAELRDAAAIS